jgi:hypothetical protein
MKYDPAFMNHTSREVLLERRKFDVIELVDQFAVNALTYTEEVCHDLFGSMMHRLHASIYGRDMDKVVVEWPKDWREHFKQRWFPKWAVKRWPVKMAQKVIVASEYYPMISAPRERHTVRIYIKD